MRPSRKLVADLAVSSVLSIIFGVMLVKQIMAGGVGSSISFIEFLSAPSNLLFCLLMCMFTVSAWLMRGLNNRSVVLCWAIMVILNSVMFYKIYDYFIYEFKNIYVLCVAGLATAVPAVLLMRYRVLITVFICERIWKAGLFRQQIGRYLRCAGSTDFECDMRLALYAGFTVEFLYSLYLISYGLINRIPYHGYITEHMQNNGNWTPYSLYYSSLDFITFVYILIILLHLYRDNKKPDAYAYGMSKQELNSAGLRLLEKSRKNSGGKNKRDH